MSCPRQLPRIQNPKARGLSRDRHIIHTIQQYRALDTDQVRALIFHDIAYGRRKAQERLQKLHREETLQRQKTRVGTYCYYIDDPPKILQHHLDLNWTRIWLEQNLPSWEKIHSFAYEDKYKELRTDGFVAIKNIATGGYRFLFIEMDRDTNPFDKVPKYCRLFEREGYQGRWWVRLTDRFPPVLIVTVSAKKLDNIRQQIAEQNQPGIEFEVRLLADIKEEVLGRCLSPSDTTGPNG